MWDEETGSYALKHGDTCATGRQAASCSRLGWDGVVVPHEMMLFHTVSLAALRSRRKRMGWGSLAWAPGLTSVEESPVG